MAEQSFFSLVPSANDPEEDICHCHDASPEEQAAFEAECDAVFWVLQNALDAYAGEHPEMTFQVARNAAECFAWCLKRFEEEQDCDA